MYSSREESKVSNTNQNENQQNQAERSILLSPLERYQQELRTQISESESKVQQLSRELQRLQPVITAAQAIEFNNRERLKAEQSELNELEDKSKQSLMEYVNAKQHYQQYREEYNTKLEDVKQLANSLQEQEAEISDKQLEVKSMMGVWQKHTFYLNKQKQVASEIEAKLAAINAGESAESIQDVMNALPPLSELQMQPSLEQELTITSNINANRSRHVNADFWEQKQHTGLKLPSEKAKQAKEEAERLNPLPDQTADFETELDAELQSAFANRASDDSPESAAIPTTGATNDGQQDNIERILTEKKRKSSPLRTLFSYVVCILLAVVLAFAIRTWVLVPTQVSGSSMEPTLESEDRLLTSPLPYLLGEPQRGDIVVFQAPNEAEGVYYVKRVIAVAGDHIVIEDGKVYLNDRQIVETYLSEDFTGGYIDTVIPSGYVFVMGDNRTVSHDSRDNDVSAISIEEIRGKAIWRITPFENFGAIQ
jgi:signal peptidase I